MFSDKINKFPGKQLVKLQACTITTELYLRYFPWNFPKYSEHIFLKTTLDGCLSKFTY